MSAPPERQRHRIYRRMCRGTLGERLIRRVSEIDHLTPAVVARAKNVAAGIHPKGEARDAAFARLVENTLRSQGHPTPPLRPTRQKPPLRFDPAFLNTNPSLDQMLQRLERNSSCRCLLHGPAGTGKSAFGHWLSKHLKTPLHLKRASDLLSPYVGEAERRIAEAFREAGHEGAVLMVDEVDTFLRDRRDAQRRWEISQVNEFLTCLEGFEGILICSTNIVDTLDPSCLRRFDLKVRIDPLRADQAQRLFIAYCRHLGLSRPTSAQRHEVTELSHLTPGDFANVARQSSFQPVAGPAQFLHALARECDAKPGSPGGKIGFH